VYGAVHQQGDVYECTLALAPFLLKRPGEAGDAAEVFMQGAADGNRPGWICWSSAGLLPVLFLVSLRPGVPPC